MTVREWRLLVTESTDGATNMAIDDALWRGRRAGTSPPTIRFFAWAPPTVSLGYGQPLDESVDVACCPEVRVGERVAQDHNRRALAEAPVPTHSFQLLDIAWSHERMLSRRVG